MSPTPDPRQALLDALTVERFSPIPVKDKPVATPWQRLQELRRETPPERRAS